MTKKEQKEIIKRFISEWKDKGNEKSDTQKFWMQLLQDVCGDEDAISHLEFEVRVHKSDSTDFKDVVINGGSENSVLVEQKSREKDLGKKYPKSGGELVTPFEQAKSYDDNSAKEDKARWIITCNFKEFWIYDMNNTGKYLLEPFKVKLTELDKHMDWLKILTAKDEDLTDPLSEEKEVSIKAGELTGVLYDALKGLYIEPDSEDTLKELNKLCVRIVFCLYAEDAGLFGDTNSEFHDYLAQYPIGKMNSALKSLFEILNTPVKDRDPYIDEDLKAFPYVNGGLFEEKVQIPVFNDKVADILLVQQSKNFDWNKISPTIFGAVFESTLNPETRRAGGMHYTAVENIHKVIDPLFLDELKKELEDALSISVTKTKNNALLKLQNKMASLKFLDPACGSGNFLTETYLCLRKIENRIINELNKGQITFDFNAKHPIKVSIGQFYGIEINDFAVAVAQTALWIAEAQMLHETEEVINTNLEFFPLKTYDNIYEGNALKMDWETVVPASELNYIMGNPPFKGQSVRTKEQAVEMGEIWGKGEIETKLDYVICWYKVAVDYMKKTCDIIKTAFVSTNSICQGESVPTFWKKIIEKGVEIQFAHKTFVWDSEATDKAVVHCVIVGFTTQTIKCDKKIFDGNTKTYGTHINPYLFFAPDIFITNRVNTPQNGRPKMTTGSPPTDDGALTLTFEEKKQLLKKYPKLEKYVRPFIGAKEFLHDNIGEYSRYCLWFKDVNPSEIKDIPELKERFEKVRNLRKNSSADRIIKMADYPYLFCQIRQPDTTYLVFPRHSSQNRKYIPIDFKQPEVIVGDACSIIPNISIVEFGILTSNVHNAWLRVVCGRIKSDFRYSPAVYNNFPYPKISDKNKMKIEKTAQEILDVRKSIENSSLAQIYDNLFMPPELVKAHNANDKAVMEAYGFKPDMEESEIVARLMEMYQELTKENR